ncbi:MAG: YceI family protein [Planctomycetota bacterium]
MRTLLSVAAASAVSIAVAVAATYAPSVAAEPTSAPGPAATTYAFDTGHSTVMFRCKHLDVNYQWGRFDKFDGSFTLGDDAASSQVSVKVEADSVNTNSKDRDKHLRGPDFFDTKQFPEMTFESTKVASKGGDVFTIAGDLTLHGVKKSITFDVTKIGEKDTRMGRRAGFEGQFEIDRNDYGIDIYPDTLGKTVRMIFAIEGVAKGS